MCHPTLSGQDVSAVIIDHIAALPSSSLHYRSHMDIGLHEFLGHADTCRVATKFYVEPRRNPGMFDVPFRRIASDISKILSSGRQLEGLMASRAAMAPGDIH